MPRKPPWRSCAAATSPSPQAGRKARNYADKSPRRTIPCRSNSLSHDAPRRIRLRTTRMWAASSPTSSLGPADVASVGKRAIRLDLSAKPSSPSVAKRRPGRIAHTLKTGKPCEIRKISFINRIKTYCITVLMSYSVYLRRRIVQGSGSAGSSKIRASAIPP